MKALEETPGPFFVLPRRAYAFGMPRLIAYRRVAACLPYSPPVRTDAPTSQCRPSEFSITVSALDCASIHPSTTMQFRLLLRALTVATTLAFCSTDIVAQDITRGRWEALIVSPENLTLVAFDMADSAIGLAVGANGTVRRTLDTGQTWSLDRIATDDTLRGVAFAAHAIVVAVGDNGSIYRSVDTGSTWNEIASPVISRLNAVTAVDHVVLVAVGDGVVLRSTDAGQAWDEVELGGIPMLNSVTSRGQGMLAVGADGVILSSTDAGATWTARTSGVDARLKHACMVTADKWLVSGDPWSVVRSSDAGSTWTVVPLRSNYTSDTRAEIVAMGFFDTARGFIAMDLRYGSRPMAPLFLIDDAGATYREVPLPGVFDTVRGDVGYHARAFVPIGEGRGIAVGVTEASRTSDWGRSWKDVRLGSTSRVLDLAFADSMNGLVLLLQNSGYGIEGGQQYASSRTTDGGRSWKRAVIHRSWEEQIRAVRVRGTTAIAVGDTGLVYRSSDLGASWSRSSTGTHARLFDVQFLDDLNVFATGGSGTAIRSTDAGITWSRIDSATSRLLWGVIPFSATRWTFIAPSGFIGAVGGALDTARSFTTTDGGTTWTTGMIASMSGSSSAFIDSMTGVYVGGTRDMSYPNNYVYRMTIARTTDGGSSWALVLDSIPPTGRSSFSSVDFADGRHGIAAGRYRALATSDAGATWVHLETPSTSQFSPSPSLIDYPDVMRAFASDGETVLRYDVAAPSSARDERAVDHNMILVPNPAHDATMLWVELRRVGRVRVNIYDAVGRETLRVYDAETGAGSHGITLDLRSLATGAYLVRVDVDGAVMTQTLLRR